MSNINDANGASSQRSGQARVTFTAETAHGRSGPRVEVTRTALESSESRALSARSGLGLRTGVRHVGLLPRDPPPRDACRDPRQASGTRKAAPPTGPAAEDSTDTSTNDVTSSNARSANSSGSVDWPPDTINPVAFVQLGIAILLLRY